MGHKILILANYDVGLYQFRKELIEELLKENEVFIALPYGELVEPLEQAGCIFIDTQLERRGMNPLKDLSLLKQYRRILKEEAPDLILTYTIKPNVYGGVAASLGKIPYAVNITGLGTAFQKQGFLRMLVTLMYKVGLKHAKVVFFENEASRELFVREGIVKWKKTFVLHGAGVNLEKYALSAYPKEQVDNITGEEQIRFLFMGRVMREKGIDELCVAVRRLVREGRNCLLDVLGSYEEDYREVIAGYEREGWLCYHGYQKDVRPYIERAHCFVLPSWHEGMANTNLECAAMGRPVITSDIPGCREAVVDGKSGFLAKKQDADSLYRAMKRFYELPYGKKKEMGVAGRLHMEEQFDKKYVVKETISKLGI